MTVGDMHAAKSQTSTGILNYDLGPVQKARRLRRHTEEASLTTRFRPTASLEGCQRSDTGTQQVDSKLLDSALVAETET